MQELVAEQTVWLVLVLLGVQFSGRLVLVAVSDHVVVGAAGFRVESW